jgi:hypothetical protein
VPSGNAEAVASELDRVLDPEANRRAREGAAELRARYGWANLIEPVAAALDDVCARARRRLIPPALGRSVAAYYAGR